MSTSSLAAGIYEIFTQNMDYAATILSGETSLRGEQESGLQWNLTYTNETAFTLFNGDLDCYLGVNSMETNETVYCLDDAQEWTVKDSGDDDSSKMIGMALGDSYYCWYLGGEGEDVVIMDSNTGMQSWMFMSNDTSASG